MRPERPPEGRRPASEGPQRSGGLGLAQVAGRRGRPRRESAHSSPGSHKQRQREALTAKRRGFRRRGKAREALGERVPSGISSPVRGVELMTRFEKRVALADLLFGGGSLAIAALQYHATLPPEQ